MENRADFTGRVVVDVGAGSGILSLFAAQVLVVIVELFFISLCIWFHSSIIKWKILCLESSTGWCKACLCCGSI